MRAARSPTSATRPTRPSGDRGLAARHAVAAAGVHHDVAGEGAAGIGDDLRRDEACSAFRREFRERPEPGVLRLEPARHFLPLQQPRVVFAQPLVLAIEVEQPFDVAHAGGDRRHRMRDRLQNRRRGIGDDDAQAIEQHDVGLAEHHQHHREHDEERRGHALGCRPHRCRHPVNRSRTFSQATNSNPRRFRRKRQ